jgi:hypothetical protein
MDVNKETLEPNTILDVSSEPDELPFMQRLPAI